MGKERDDKGEFLVSLSVVALISSPDSTKLLLVKDRNTGKWGPPAGRLKFLEDENRVETFIEGMARELFQETGIRLSEEYPPQIKALINLPGDDKNRIGAVFDLVIDEDVLENYIPTDMGEVESLKLFSEDELLALLDQDDGIDRPEFNRGLIIWWIRNEHRDRWDPYRGANPFDTILDERYLARWSKKPESIRQIIFET